MGADSLPRVRSGLLERDAELAAVQAIVDGAQTGRGRFVAFEGSAGIGKTTLLAEARSLAESAGLHVLGARAGELEGEFAFGVVRQLLEPTVASAPEDVRAELFAGAASLAAPLFDTAPVSAPETSFGVLHGLFWLAANLTAIAPTMLVVDDMHWADEPSLRWLAFLGRRLTDLPLLVVVATRPPDESKRPALVAEVLSEPDGTLIRPGLLRLASVERLVEERLGVAPSPPFAAALHHASAG